MDLTEPFANLRKKNAEFIWSEKQQKAFGRLKVIMAKKPVGKIILSKKGHYVNQRCKQTFNIWNIISRRLANTEFNYSNIEKEAVEKRKISYFGLARKFNSTLNFTQSG